MKSNQFIFRVFSAIERIEQRSGMKGLDPGSREILWRVADALASNEVLVVTHIIHWTDLGTAPTIYRRLRELEVSGWVVYVGDALDGRKKLVRLTDKAMKVFSQMSKCLRELGRS